MPAPLLSDEQFETIKARLAEVQFVFKQLSPTTDIYGAKCALINYSVRLGELEYPCAIQSTVFGAFTKKAEEVCVIPEFPEFLLQECADAESAALYFCRSLAFAQRQVSAHELLEVLLTWPQEAESRKYAESDVISATADLVYEKARSFFGGIEKALQQNTDNFVLQEPAHLAQIEADFHQAEEERDIVEMHVHSDRKLVKEVTPKLKYESLVAETYQAIIEARGDAVERICSRLLPELEQHAGVFEALMKKVNRARLIEESIQNEVDTNKRQEMLQNYTALTEQIGEEYLVAREFSTLVRESVANFYSSAQNGQNAEQHFE